jgi:hypothetical protein
MFHTCMRQCVSSTRERIKASIGFWTIVRMCICPIQHGLGFLPLGLASCVERPAQVSLRIRSGSALHYLSHQSQGTLTRLCLKKYPIFFIVVVDFFVFNHLYSKYLFKYVILLIVFELYLVVK